MIFNVQEWEFLVDKGVYIKYFIEVKKCERVVFQRVKRYGSSDENRLCM